MGDIFILDIDRVSYEIDKNGCYLCTSHRVDKDGYPKIRHKGKTVAASRYVYEIYNGDIPDGMIIRHKCDNPLCINPLHLEIGTHKDNVMDKVHKNRQARGSSNGRHKLTESEVISIYYSTDRLFDLSKKYNISYRTIRNIQNKLSWKHVTSDLPLILNRNRTRIHVVMYGSKNPQNKISEKDVINIFNSTDSNKEIAQRYKVSVSTIADIKHGRTWSWITGVNNVSL